MQSLLLNVRHAAKLAALITAPLAFCANTNAAVITWDGGGGNGLWNDAANWSGDVLPTPLDEVRFDSTGSGNVVATSAVAISALSMTGFAGRLDILGSFSVSGTSFIAASTINFMSGSAAMLGHVDIAGGGIFTSVSGDSVLTFRNGVRVDAFGTWRLGGASEVIFSEGSLVDINFMSNVYFLGDGPGSELRMRSDSEGPLRAWFIDVDAGSLFGAEFISLSSSIGMGTAAPLYAFDSVDSGFNQNWIFQTSTAPIPEPETYAMLIAGLAILGFRMRKRKLVAA